MKKRILALVLATLTAFLTLGLAGCGGKTDTETSTEPAADEKVVVVGYTIYEPMNYKDENDKLVGFDTELAEIVFENLGYEVMFKEIQWDSKYTDLDSGTIDCVWNGFTANTADDDGVLRSEKVDFSYNYMENKQAVIAKKDAGFATAADLKGKIGVGESGSAGETYAKTFEDVKYKGLTKQTDCLLEIVSGTADFGVVDVQLAKSYVGKGDYADLTIIEGLYSDPEFYAIGFKKGSPLVAEVNAQLEILGANGTIAELGEKYGVPDTVITDFSNQK